MTAKEMAQVMVGDGQSPNKYFVTFAPWYLPYGKEEHELIPGFHADNRMTVVFDNKDMAMEYYSDVVLNFKKGIGQVMVEDRMVGVLCERFLKEKVVYVEEEVPEMPI